MFVHSFIKPSLDINLSLNFSSPGIEAPYPNHYFIPKCKSRNLKRAKQWMVFKTFEVTAVLLFPSSL